MPPARQGHVNMSSGFLSRARYANLDMSVFSTRATAWGVVVRAGA